MIKLNHIYQGNTLEVLREFPSECVDLIVTSPPYWGLRDYGEETKTLWGGDDECDHAFGEDIKYKISNNNATESSTIQQGGYSHKGLERDAVVSSFFCTKCGAWHGQLGLEPSLDLYLDHLLQITAELRRVLKPSGVMYWNHGDSYASSGSLNSRFFDADGNLSKKHHGRCRTDEIPIKSLVMQNHRLAMRMIDEQSWILRNIIIWNKLNHMPSSAQDRFTGSYEPVYMFVRNRKYWFDLDVVRVPHKNVSIARAMRGVGSNHKYSDLPSYGGGGGGVGGARPNISKKQNVGIEDTYLSDGGKNPGDVWTLSTQPFPDAHFAVFPEKLVEPMVLSSCPEEICKECGFIRVRITEPSEEYSKLLGKSWNPHIDNHIRGQSLKGLGHLQDATADYKTVGWSKCECGAGWERGVVLDPFTGSGTTALVALKNNRRFIGIELNPEYIKIAEKRIAPYVNQARLSQWEIQ